jgi:hypothetical protein
VSLDSDSDTGRVIQLDELRDARGWETKRSARLVLDGSDQTGSLRAATGAEAADFDSRLHAGMLVELDELRAAQRNLETQHQLDGALALMSRIGTPRTSTDAMELADALNFAVDGYCNKGQTAEACALAAETVELIYELDPNRRRRFGRSPRTFPAVYAARVHAHAIEYNGDPDDAIHRLLALHMTLSKTPEIGASPLDSLLILRGLLSSAKRDGSSTARRYADRARQQGDAILAKLEAADSSATVAVAVASYCHRAAIERRARQGASARGEAIELFERSLSLRPNTPRDLRSRGMAVGDLHVLRGDRKEGARILTATVAGFEDVLPRHFDSARAQLIERDLLIAA